MVFYKSISKNCKRHHSKPFVTKTKIKQVCTYYLISGWGPHPCSPYSYEAFVIAARYFPLFGADDGHLHFASPSSSNTTKFNASSSSSSSSSSSEEQENYHKKRRLRARDNWRRDLAAFFAHAVQETGENDANLYSDNLMLNVSQAHNCFYRFAKLSSNVL